VIRSFANRCPFAAAAVLLAVGGLCHFASAAPHIVLGPADGLLLGYPTALVGFEDPANPDVLVGPLLYDEFVLDTGANGILLAQAGYYDNDFGIDPNLYSVAQNNGQPVGYLEQGTAGYALLDVFQPYNVYVSELPDGSNEFLAGTFRAFGSSTVDLEDIPGLLGMSVMNHHTIDVNLRNLVNPDANFFAMTSTFDNPTPPVATTFTVPLGRLPAEHPGQLDPSDPLPTFGDIPTIPHARFQVNDASADLTAVLDTGAGLSFISTAAAISLGIDPVNDVEDYIDVGGLGGTASIPIVHIDRLTIPTDQGVDLVFDQLDVGLLDIEGIDAVIGEDALTGGYFEPQLNAIIAWLDGDPIPDDYGYFSSMIFDFTADDWSMRLDVNPAFYNVVLPGDTNADGVVNLTDLNNVKDYFGTDGSLGGATNADGVVNLTDLNDVKNNFGQSLPSAGLNAVPEPASLLLCLISPFILCSLRRPAASISN
jgi:Aspartyl protease